MGGHDWIGDTILFVILFERIGIGDFEFNKNDLLFYGQMWLDLRENIGLDLSQIIWTWGVHIFILSMW